MRLTPSMPSFLTARVLPLLAMLVPLVFIATSAWAKRAAPKPVPPVVVGTVEYAAPREQMGFVVASDTTSHKELWRQRIYTVKIDPLLERDVQEVFISSLGIESGVLVITNERGDSYTLDPGTRKVSKRK